MDLSYDFTFELTVDPGRPYKHQLGFVTVRVSDLDAEFLAEGRVTDPKQATKAIARAGHFATTALREVLTRDNVPQRMLFEVSHKDVMELSEVDPQQIQFDEWCVPAPTVADSVPTVSAPADAEPTDDEPDSPDPRRVFVVHGRNMAVRDDFFALLRSFGLEPIEWAEAVRETGKASPYIGEILDAAFSRAQAVAVLLTPDDEVRLTSSLHTENEPILETATHLQARPNVLFEAGMAFGR